jgi:Arabinose efflux permease
VPWYTIPHLRELNLIILSLLMYSGTVGYDGSMMNGLQSLTQWQTFMKYPIGAWLGFINAAMTLGGFVTLPCQAWTADRFGRRCCLFIGLFFCALGTALQTAAYNHAMFILGRFFIGVSSAWFGISVVLITEIAYPSHRAKVTALFQCQYCTCNPAWIPYNKLTRLTYCRHRKHSCCLGDLWRSKHAQLLGMAHTISFANSHSPFCGDRDHSSTRVPSLVSVERPSGGGSGRPC